MHKISRKQLALGARRKDRPRKRRQSFNPKDPETDDSSFTGTSAKKLKGDDKQHMPEEDTLQYSIIDFALVFSTLSSFVRWSNIIDDEDEDQLCNGKVQSQNNNESFNQLIWKITPKILPAGSKIVNIAALVAACIFNEGTSALLLIMHGMDLKLGRNSHEYARISDENRVCAAENKSVSETREARIRHRQEQKDARTLQLLQDLYFIAQESTIHYGFVRSYADNADAPVFRGVTGNDVTMEEF